MEDDLKKKWKTTSEKIKMEDDLKKKEKRKKDDIKKKSVLDSSLI
jgi:hypothetical protein